jgi:hypothetical protein
MRDARLLAWILAQPEKSGALLPSQWRAVLAMAQAEGLASALAHRLEGQVCPDDVMLALNAVKQEGLATLTIAQFCSEADRLFVALDLHDGLKALWQMDRAVQQSSEDTNFWHDLLQQSRERGITLAVSRAMRLCHHLFQTPVDPYLAWQGRRNDIFFVGRLLARDGEGQERARWLRLAFRILRSWRQRRHSAR